MKIKAVVRIPLALALTAAYTAEPGSPVPSSESVRQERKPSSGAPMSATPVADLRKRSGSDRTDIVAPLSKVRQGRYERRPRRASTRRPGRVYRAIYPGTLRTTDAGRGRFAYRA